MNSTDIQLQERVKELKCLYELSKVAWEAQNDLDSILSKTLEILPHAMQHASLAEACISVNQVRHATAHFNKCKLVIASTLTHNKKKYGTIEIGYRAARGKSATKVGFLSEEKKLLKTVARQLSVFINRAAVEEEKEKLTIQLQHVERLAFVGELSAGIAHELNEPLGRILGFAQLIKKGTNLSDQQHEDLERIIKASLYTREIIKKLMIFSRQMPQQISKVDLNAIVTNILYFIDVRFQSRGIEIKKVLDGTLPEINADEVQISQVLVNLITNSVHAMPKGGVITVTTGKKKSNVVLIVKDTGEGMSPAVKERIFEPFFTTKPVGQGTGLGLSVVQGIIDAHRGKIHVTSSPEKGSKFEIVLPLKPGKGK